MSRIPSVHDTFLRAILADKQIAVDYFKASLPDFVKEKLNFSTLTQQTDSYVSHELKKTLSDIVYSCQRNDGKRPVKVSLLIEHKSYIDKRAPIQIGSYIFSGLLKQVSNKEEPSLIIPILLYHGPKRWEYKTLGNLFADLEPTFGKFIPDFEYIYHNLGEIDDEQIRKLNNKFLVASLLAMKHSLVKSELETLIPEILSMTQGVNKNLQSNLIVYIFVTSGLEEQRIVAILETLPLTIKETVMSTLDIFVEKGKRIGREEGLAEGRVKGIAEGKAEGKAEGFAEGKKKNAEKVVRNLIRVSTLTDEQIASVAEVQVEYVTQMRADISRSN